MIWILENQRAMKILMKISRAERQCVLLYEEFPSYPFSPFFHFFPLSVQAKVQALVFCARVLSLRTFCHLRAAFFKLRCKVFLAFANAPKLSRLRQEGP
jgi:hypothetical protein